MSEPLNIREQIEIAVSLAEGQFREFKSALMGPPGSKINRPAKEICRDIAEGLVAFANADGGEFLVGVEDDGEITGLNDFKDTDIALIKGAPVTHVHKDTPLQSVLVREISIDNKKIIYFRIAKGTQFIHLTTDGRCLRRSDLQSIPVPAERIQFERIEVRSREYDRDFMDGASVIDLEIDLVRIVANQISEGISSDKCLQYLGLAEYDGLSGLRLRRAALLLFGKSPDQWHPRLQVRILKINGTELGAGASYNVVSDSTIKCNIVHLIDEAWENLRPHLVETRFHEDARFRATYIYPEVACREALVNAIAHRDYSDEGRGIEIFIFNDRIEIKNPGSLLSSMSVSDISQLKGIHQSRNSYIARTLREIGIMQELGEGMRRIFELMKSNELAPPEIVTGSNLFTLSLHHRPMYNKDEVLWLSQYDHLSLSPEEKAVILIGRRGDLFSPNDIIRRLGIVDTEHYRKVVDSLLRKRVLESAISKIAAKQQGRKRGVGQRDVPRFKIIPAKDLTFKRFPSVTAQSNSDIMLDEGGALYVSNLPPNTTERDFTFALSEFGEVQSIVIPRSGGDIKGFAFLEFSSREVASKVLNKGITFGGRRLVIKWKRIPTGVAR